MGLEPKSFLKLVEPYQLNETIDNFVLDEKTESRLYDVLADRAVILTLSTKCKGCFYAMEELERYIRQAEGVTWIVLLECDDEDIPIIRQALPAEALVYPISRESMNRHMRVLGVPWVTMLNDRQVVLHHPHDKDEMFKWIDMFYSRSDAGAV